MRATNTCLHGLSAAFGAFAIVTTCAVASAEPRCVVRLRTAMADGAASWRGAVSDVDHLVAARSRPGDDCREIVVDADERGADVTFTTPDDRTATRRITSPVELKSVVQALLVTVPAPDEPLAAAASRPPLAAAPTVSARAEPTAWKNDDPADLPPDLPVDQLPRKVDDAAGPIVALGAGVTAGAGGPGGVAQLEAGYLTRGWELALVGRVEPEHDAAGATVHSSLSASGVSVLAARRAPWGPVTVMFGGTIGVFYASEEGPRPSVDGVLRHTDSSVDPRLGAMLGCIAPRIGPLRFRGQIDAQVGLAGHTPEYADLAPFPRFTIAFSLGAETGFVP